MRDFTNTSNNIFVISRFYLMSHTTERVRAVKFYMHVFEFHLNSG